MKKKIIVLGAILACMFLITGCGGNNGGESPKGTLEEIMTKIYEGIEEENLPMGLTNMEVTEENVESFLGTSEIEYKEALASESMVGSIAYSVVLVRANNTKDVEDLKTKIEENINPRKWICVGVEKEEVIIKNKGDLIIVIVVGNEDTRAKIEKGFNEL